MGNCAYPGCNLAIPKDAQGNHLRGCFCSLHSKYNTTYKVWTSIADHDGSMAKDIYESDAAFDRVIAKQSQASNPQHRCVLCQKSCAYTSSQAGLCAGCFQTQMACKSQGILGYFG